MVRAIGLYFIILTLLATPLAMIYPKHAQRLFARIEILKLQTPKVSQHSPTKREQWLATLEGYNIPVRDFDRDIAALYRHRAELAEKYSQ